MVAYTKGVHLFTAGIVFLRKHLVETVSAQESVHIVVLRLMGHKEHVVITHGFQHCRQSLTVRCHRPLHQVPLHQCGEGVECRCDAVIGVYAGRIAVGERPGTLIEAVESGGDTLLLPEGLHQTGRHRFHQDDDNVWLRCCGVGCDVSA